MAIKRQNFMRCDWIAKRSLVAWLAPLAIGILLSIGFLQFISTGVGAQEDTPGSPEAGEAPAVTNLVVETRVSAETVLPGGWLTWTVRYTNTTGSAIANVVITDTIGPKMTYDCATYQSTPDIPAAQFSCSGAANIGYTLYFNLPSLAAYANGSILFATRVITDPEPGGVTAPMLLGNAVKIGSKTQPASGNADDAVAMIVGPILSIEKSGSPGTVLPGRIITYTLTVKNASTATRPDSIAATNLVIRDTMPTNTTFRWADSGGVFDLQSNQVIWNIPGPLNPGGSLVVKFSVVVNPNAPGGVAIANLKTKYDVDCDEMKLAPIQGKNNVTTAVEHLVVKSATAKRMSAGTPLVYPTDEITYTLTVHNPYTVTLTGVIITDTLPGAPGPFIYKRPAFGSPAPTVSPDGRKLSWTVNIPAWGSVNLSFVVQVPQNVTFTAGKDTTDYLNAVAVKYPTFILTRSGLAKVTVEAPLVMTKVVNPNHGMPGETVVYTITLNNRGPFLINSIRLTDTLPLLFQYLNMVGGGPSPLGGYPPNIVVWTNLSVASKTTYSLSFAVRIDGSWPTSYPNNLSAYSPVVYIPPKVNIAAVKIDPPIGINKTVELAPAMPQGNAPELVYTEEAIPIVYIGDVLRYNLQVFNYSAVMWTMSYIEDLLPTGLYQVGGTNGNPAVISFPPGGQPILANQSWQGSFNARVSNDVRCSDLPKIYYNAKGNIDVYFSAPEELSVSNIENLAPIEIRPNINVTLTPYRYAVEPGDLVTYTLKLENVSRTPAVNATVTLNLPATFVYQYPVSGPVPSVSGVQLTYTGLNIPAGATLTSVFVVLVPPSISTGVKNPGAFSGSAMNICFGKLQGGSVSVLNYVLVLSKKALSTKLAPKSLVEFEISVANKDNYDYPVAVLTDTMPANFTYYDMTLGPAPQVQGGKLLWKNLVIPKSGLTMKVRLQASPLYGVYRNAISGYTPGTAIQPDESDNVEVLPLFDLKKDAGRSQAIAGAIVPYTITLVNQSSVAYNNIWITDTLPAGFNYYRTVTTNHSQIRLKPSTNQVAWYITRLNSGCTGGCTLKIVFEALVTNFTAGTYYNIVIGASPSGSIPGPITAAPVTLEQPKIIFLPCIRK